MNMTASEIVEKLRTDSLDTREATLKIMDLCMESACLIESLQFDNKLKQSWIKQLENEVEQLKTEKPVRCGECKYEGSDDCAMVGYCDGCDCQVDLAFNSTGFCSRGKRRGT